MNLVRIALFSIILTGSCLAAESKDPPKKEEAKKDPKDMTADELEAASLCLVDKNPSKPIYHVDGPNGKTYHFCTRKCAEAFKADPAKYGVKAEKAEGK